MGSLCDAYENEVLDHLLMVGTAFTPPSTLYLALFTADPTDTGSVANEATYTGYARKAIAFGAASGRSITQGAQVTFDACTGGSNTISHYGIMASDVETTSDMIAYGSFSSSKVVSSGYTPFVPANGIVISFNSGGIYTAFATVVLDWLFRAQSLTRPSNLYFALHSTACSDSAPGTEISNAGYARAEVNTWDAASGGASANTNIVTFAQATENWSQAVYASIYDASTAGTAMFYADTNDLTVLNGEYARFTAGSFDITLG